MTDEPSLKKRILQVIRKPHVVIPVAVVVLVAAWLILGTLPVSGDHTPVRLVIKKGEHAGDVARTLSKQGLIRNQYVFKLICKVTGKGEKLKPGVYELNQAMSVSQVVDWLAKGESIGSWVTVPEGFTIRQIADLLDSKKLSQGTAFTGTAVENAAKFHQQFPFIASDSLEGYLFPDTYLIDKGTDTNEIIQRMLNTFKEKVVVPCQAQLGPNPSEKLKQILIVASLIEREAKTPEDRPLVSAVLWNRLAKNMRLEVDATVSYVPGESTNNKDRVLYSDLAIDSPYNTYKHEGLPPGPICNPGLACIQAALNPAKVDYLYYVAKPDGSHIFSRTFEEHKRAKAAIRNGGQ